MNEQMMMDKFDRAAIKFLRRVRHIDPTLDQVAALVGSLCEQLDDELRAELEATTEKIEEQFGCDGPNLAFNDRVREFAEAGVDIALAENDGDEDRATNDLAHQLMSSLRDAYDHVCWGIAADVVWVAQQKTGSLPELQHPWVRGGNGDV